MSLIQFFSYSAFDIKNGWDKNYNITLSNSYPFIKVREIGQVQITPDPSKFTLDAVKQVGNHLVLRIFYHEAKNYEGKKILVFKNCTYQQIVNYNNGVIDPHFAENPDYISPFARFEPTNEGWLNAIRLCETL